MNKEEYYEKKAIALNEYAQSKNGIPQERWEGFLDGYDAGFNEANMAPDKSELDMTSLEFFNLIKQEWCKSEEQHKAFFNDLIRFARKYKEETFECCGTCEPPKKD